MIGVGIFCSTWDNRLNTNHTLRLSKLSKETLLYTFEKNVKDFLALLELSCSMGLTIFRLGSNFIPFASHERFDNDWLLDVESRLRLLSDKIKSYGIRITMHPGQFVVLNSPREDVVRRSLKELSYHMWVLDTMGLSWESIIVVHVGGVYGNKREALKRFEKTIGENEWLTKRLAIENDEKYYTAEDVVELGEKLGLPVVFDYYHHLLNPSAFSIDRLVETWRGTTPEFHLSSLPEGVHKLGEHGDFVKLEDFLDLANLWGNRGPLDVVIEAKKKEVAVEKLIQELERVGYKLRRPKCFKKC
ncbi:MAG: UV DNA damage repair endonuclease UvsE [Sulfolobales archaeon]